VIASVRLATLISAVTTADKLEVIPGTALHCILETDVQTELLHADTPIDDLREYSATPRLLPTKTRSVS
jgi:hypothetical protein